jgi:hypothetical protein
MYKAPGMTHERVNDLFAFLTTGPLAPLKVFEQRGRGQHEKLVGLRAVIDALERKEGL